MSEMNADTGELISALVDGELSAGELVMAVERASCAPEGLAAWQAYHLVGEALRGNRGMSAVADGTQFLERLRGRLAEEPSGRRVSALSEPVPVVVLARPESANDAVVRWKLIAGAASLAAVASLGWHLASQQLAPETLATAPLQAPSSVNVQVAAPGAALAAAIPVVAVQPPVMLRDARLDALLAAHKQYGGTSALQMPAGFLRNATFDDSSR